MLDGRGGIPGIEKRTDGRGSLTGGIFQNFQMLFSAGFKASFGALGLTLVVHAEQVGRRITQKICRNIGRALDLCGHGELLRQHLFTVWRGLLEGRNIEKGTVRV